MNPPDLPKYLPHSQNCPLSLRSYLPLKLNSMQRLQKKLRRVQKYSLHLQMNLLCWLKYLPL